MYRQVYTNMITKGAHGQASFDKLATQVGPLLGPKHTPNTLGNTHES